MTQLSDKTELGLAPRLVAAGWFGLAACIPIVFFFLVFARTDGGGAVRTDSQGWWFFLNLPVSWAAFFGFTIGSRILDVARHRSPSGVLVRGIAVAVSSYLALPATNVILAVLFLDYKSGMGQSFGSFLLWMLIIYGVGAIWVGWIIVIAGGIAGLLLYRVSQSEILRTRLMKARRVNKKSVYAWTALAIAMLFAANIFIFLLPSLLLTSQRFFFRILDRLDPVAVSMQHLGVVVLR